LAEEVPGDGSGNGVSWQYWGSLWNVLEGEFDKLLLVNPPHTKGLDGRNTDPKDAQWIAELLETGRLKGSWVPPRPIRELRDLTRQRVHTLEDLNRTQNRIQQLCRAAISKYLRWLPICSVSQAAAY
jgi:transposase